MCKRLKNNDGDCGIVAGGLDSRFDGDCLNHCKSVKKTCMPSASDGTCTFNNKPMSLDLMCNRMKRNAGDCDLVAGELDLRFGGDCLVYCKSVKKTCMPSVSPPVDPCLFKNELFSEGAMCVRLKNLGLGRCSGIDYDNRFSGNCDGFCAYVQQNCVNGKYKSE